MSKHTCANPTTFCIDCGKPVARGSKRCATCSGKARANPTPAAPLPCACGAALSDHTWRQRTGLCRACWLAQVKAAPRYALTAPQSPRTPRPRKAPAELPRIVIPPMPALKATPPARHRGPELRVQTGRPLAYPAPLAPVVVAASTECPTHRARPTLLLSEPEAGALYRCPVAGCLWAAWLGAGGWDVLTPEPIAQVAA